MLGKRLRYLREKNNLSQLELAKRLGIPNQNISNYERGFRHPDFDTLNMIADYFGVTTDYLLGRTDVPYPDDSYDPIKEIKKIADEYGIKDLSFYDLEEWKNFTKEDVEDIKKHFEYIAYRARKRKEEEK